MKKKKRLLIVVPLLILAFILSAWLFINGVSSQLWMNSIRVITESTHQGANALNMQFEADFATLERLWGIVGTASAPNVPELYRTVEPDVALYVFGQDNSLRGPDGAVDAFLEEDTQARGVVEAHTNSATGENVFNIFARGVLADGTGACLVKEYQTQRIAQQFTLTFFDNEGFSYLVDREGCIVVRSGHSNSNKTVSNIFDMVSEGEGPALETFRDSVRRLKTGWVRFTIDGMGVVFCYEPLRPDSEWLLVSIVPERVITGQTRSILAKALLFCAAALVALLLVVAVFVEMKMRESETHTRALAHALVEADTANRAKGRFLMDMSHDIRTPLNAIIGMTAIARENIADRGRLEDCLREIKSSSTHLLSLVSDVMDMSQIEQGKMILKEETVQLPRLFEETAELMGRKARRAGLTLTVSPVLLRHDTVMGDPLRIRQILFNISSNAVQYTPSGGHVWLALEELEEENGYAVYQFRCADTGIGMEPEFIKRLFMPFERARNTTVSKIAGTGVGLAITKSLLDLMGGSIAVESAPEQGSTFTVRFRFQPQEPLPEPEPLETAAAEAELDYGGKRVLLVEDNELNMEILEELLSLTGVQIEKAFDGQEAVQMVEKSPGGYYDLILMDIQMPVMDGYEATRCIRKLGRELPIYAVSANALASDVENALNAGMNGHIAKPVDLDVLEKVLKKCLRQKQS